RTRARGEGTFRYLCLRSGQADSPPEEDRFELAVPSGGAGQSRNDTRPLRRSAVSALAGTEISQGQVSSGGLGRRVCRPRKPLRAAANEDVSVCRFVFPRLQR